MKSKTGVVLVVGLAVIALGAFFLLFDDGSNNDDDRGQPDIRIFSPIEIEAAKAAQATAQKLAAAKTKTVKLSKDPKKSIETNGKTELKDPVGSSTKALKPAGKTHKGTNAHGGKRKYSKEYQRKRENRAKKYSYYLKSKKLTIKGRVIDEQRSPVAKASLAFKGSDKFPVDSSALTATTDSDGRFTVSGTMKRFLLVVTAPAGLEDKEILVPWVEGSEIDLGEIVLRASTLLTGRVLDSSEKGIQGARVLLMTAVEYDKFVRNQNVAYAEETGAPTVEQVSGEDGQFQVKAPPGDYLLLSTAKGYRESAPLSVGKGAGATNDLALKLRPGLTLTVLVKNNKDEPMENATVRLARYGQIYNANWKNKWLAELKCNSSGQVVFPALENRRYQIMAFAEGYAPKALNSDFQFDKNAQSVSLTVQTSSRVIGKLMSKESPEGMRGTALLYAEGSDGRIDTRRIFSHVPVPTDGNMNLGDLSHGRYVLALFAQGHFPLSMNLNIKNEGKETDLGEIEMKVLKNLEVIVFNGTGQAAQGLSVSQSPNEYTQLVELKTDAGKAVTDSSGRFLAINVPSGATTFTVLDSNKKVMGFHKATIADADDNTVTITLPETYGNINIRTNQPEGQSQAALRLELVLVGGHVTAIPGVVNAEGLFELKDVPPGQYNILLYLPGQPEGSPAGQVSVTAGKNPEKSITVPAGG
ncbi:MAG: carboxypeptidase-like regulatory domain-containing protein [Planctomycetota bacterium]|nr:carboxypeptidase-like regulatory domain-containing protein [Planctomycetota bacterium]